MNRSLTSYLRTPQSERGSSLLEVLIASLIMSLVGLALITVVVGAKPLAERFNAKSAALTSLTFAAKQIQLQPIADTNCTSNVQPYYFGINSQKGGMGFVVAVNKNFSPTLPIPATGYTYAISPAALPTGLSMNQSTGLITGTPTTEGTSIYTVTASNGTSISKEIIYVTVISVAVKVDVASSTMSTDFQGCSTNAAGISTATAAYTKKQIIQEVVLTTTTNSTQTTRTIVKMG